MSEIPNGLQSKDGGPSVIEVSVTYLQDGDSNDANEQRLRLSTVLADGALDEDDDFPFYINLEVLPNCDNKQGHWSLDGDMAEEEICNIIRNFKKKVLAK